MAEHPARVEDERARDDVSVFDPEADHPRGQTRESETGAEYEEDETMPVIYSVLAIAIGAAIGANLRWGLGLGLNSLLPQMPPGTLVANLLGAFLIGLAVAAFSAMPQLSSFWRLLVVTGFLGALTTFSTFSSEIYTQLQDGRLAWALVGIATHVLGSLLMVALGAASFAGLRHLTGATA